MKYVLISLSIVFASFGVSQDSQNKEVNFSNEAKINLATHFLPEKDKNEAKILSYSSNSIMMVLRESDSHLTCVMDDPNKEGIQIVCYYNKLEDFMQRGRVLKAQGISPIEIREIRKVEIESGKLFFPEGQSILYVLNGKEENLDKETGVLKDAKLRYVIYTPYATQETTGLPLSPAAPGMPWLMDPGTHRAHIMVSPN